MATQQEEARKKAIADRPEKKAFAATKVEDAPVAEVEVPTAVVDAPAAEVTTEGSES